MKKLLLTTSAVFALSTVCAPAFADSYTIWNLNKQKYTEINEVTNIEKTVNVEVADVTELDSNAQALAVVNDNIHDDLVTFATVGQVGSSGGVDNTGGFQTGYTENGTPIVGTGALFAGYEINFGIHRNSLITNSVNNDTGVGEMNQDSGANTDQGNTISAAFVFDGGPANITPAENAPAGVQGADVAQAEAYVDQSNTDNWAADVEATPDPNHLVPLITATLTGSFNHDTGVFFGNQNAGDMNSQQNALAAAVGGNTLTALSDAGLNQVNEGNQVFDVNTIKADAITNSINHDQGIVAFNQSVGDMNNQATVVSVAAIAAFVALPSQ